MPASLVRLSISALTATTSVLPDMDSAATSGLSTNGYKTPAASGNAEQNEHQPTSFEDEGGADTEEIAGADAQHDQRRHAQGALPDCAPGGDEERPARIHDRERGEAEQPHVEVEATDGAGGVNIPMGE